MEKGEKPENGNNIQRIVICEHIRKDTVLKSILMY